MNETPDNLRLARPRGNAPVLCHVNMALIKHNAKHGTKYPCLTIKVPGQGTFYSHEVKGYATVVDSNARGRKPLDCGARIWIEYSRETFEFCDQPMRWPELKALLALDREAAELSKTLEAAETAVCALAR